MKFKGILFDLDGTLLDTSGLIVASFQYAFAQCCGLTVNAEKLYPFFGRTLAETVREIAPQADLAAVKDSYREHHMLHYSRMTETFPNVVDTIKTLWTNGVKLAVVTSRRRETAQEGLALFNINDCFDTVVGAYQTRHNKPHPEPVLLALNELSLKPRDCLMVGDSPADLISGRTAGTGTAAVRWTHLPWAELAAERPDYVLSDISELLPLSANKI